MENQNKIENDILKIKKRFYIFYYFSGIFVVLSGLFYSFFQWKLNGTIADTTFISLSIGESLFVLYAGSRILRLVTGKGKSFYTLTVTPENPEHSKKEYLKLIKAFGSANWTIPVILVWSVVMGYLPFLQQYWDNQVLLVFYGVFLFFINIITSYFLILLIHFFVISNRLWKLVKVELWNRNTASANLLFRLSRSITLVAAVYMSSSLTAWFTSPKVEAGNEVYLFMAFSIILLIGCIVIPIMPHVNKIARIKQNALNDIDDKIQGEYNGLINELRSKDDSINFEKMNALIEMRSRVEGIHVFPFRLKTITASISIVLISLTPILLEYFFNLLFK